MKHPLSRFAPSLSLASREGNDALTAGRPLLGVPGFWQRRFQSLGVVVNAIEN